MLGHRKLNMDDYLGIWKRRRTLILLCAVIFPVLAIASTFFLRPRFVSQTLVLVDEQKVPDEYVKAVVSSNLDSRLASMKEQILSRSQLQPIIERYNLYGDDRLNMDDRMAKVRKDVLITPIKSTVSNSRALPGFFIAVTARDPHTAMYVCRDITSLFVSENLETRQASAEGTTTFLANQLKDAKANLDEQDAKLAAFQRQYGGKLPSESGTNMNMLTSVNARLEASTQALGQMEQNLSYQQSMLASQIQAETPAIPVFSSADGSTTSSAVPLAGTPAQQAEMQSLLAQQADLTSHYTADYPDVKIVRRKIAELRSQMVPALAPGKPGSPPVAVRPPESVAVQQLRAQIHSSEIGIQQKRQEQAQIQAAAGMYEARIQSSPQVEEQYKQITRDYDTANKFYDDLLAKLNRSKMATDLERTQEGEQFHVMDKPNLPDAPTFPNKLFFALGGIVFGLGLGSLLAAWLEYKDTALRSERDVWAFTHLPTLATISIVGDLAQQDKPSRRGRKSPTLTPESSDTLAGSPV